MTQEELEAKYRPLVEPLFTLRSVHRVNHKPHPFTIGPTHIAYASDHYGGLLGLETLERVPCARRGCGLPLKDHTSDHVIFLSLTRNLTNREAAEVLSALKPDLEADKLDGIAFVETEEQFRIAPPEPTTLQEAP